MSNPNRDETFPGNLTSLLEKSIKNVPALKYAWGVVGVAVVLSILSYFNTDLDYNIPVKSFLIIIGFIFLIFVFSFLTNVRDKVIRVAFYILTYVIILVLAVMLFSLPIYVFTGVPKLYDRLFSVNAKGSSGETLLSPPCKSDSARYRLSYHVIETLSPVEIVSREVSATSESTVELHERKADEAPCGRDPNCIPRGKYCFCKAEIVFPRVLEGEYFKDSSFGEITCPPAGDGGACGWNTSHANETKQPRISSDAREARLVFYTSSHSSILFSRAKVYKLQSNVNQRTIKTRFKEIKDGSFSFSLPKDATNIELYVEIDGKEHIVDVREKERKDIGLKRLVVVNGRFEYSLCK